MRKTLIIVIGGIVVVGAAYFMLAGRTDQPQVYYQDLAEKCEGKESISCCIASVTAMQTAGYQLASEGKCQEGYVPNMMKCADSYRWCQPE